jgi:hypothetical protein
VVNVIGPFDISVDGQKSIKVTTLENLFIHHPDTLLTPSLLASAPNCQRRPLVTALVRAPSPPTPALVYGTVLHDVVQTCLKEKRWDAPWIEARVDTALSMAFGDLVRAGVTLSVAKDEILRRAAGVETFGERYIGDEPKVSASISCRLSAHNYFTSLKLYCPILAQPVGRQHSLQSAHYTILRKIFGPQLTVSEGSSTPQYRLSLFATQGHQLRTPPLSRSRQVVPSQASNTEPKPCCIRS